MRNSMNEEQARDQVIDEVLETFFPTTVPVASVDAQFTVCDDAEDCADSVKRRLEEFLSKIDFLLNQPISADNYGQMLDTLEAFMSNCVSELAIVQADYNDFLAHSSLEHFADSWLIFNLLGDFQKKLGLLQQKFNELKHAGDSSMDISEPSQRPTTSQPRPTIIIYQSGNTFFDEQNNASFHERQATNEMSKSSFSV